MSDQIVPIVPGGGNTKPPLEHPKLAKKQISPAKRWCFTYNNYPKDWFSTFKSKVVPKIHKFIVGLEVGESGTPHLQGYVEFLTKCRPATLWDKSIHWEKAKGDIAANIAYCSKDGNFVKSQNVIVDEPIRVIQELRPWQQQIVDIISQRPDDRTIHWYWDEHGNTGKSALVRYLVHHHNALICSGKASDMKYLIVKFREIHGSFPQLIIFDIPRTMLDYLNYTGVEEIKNGCFASTKYECSTILMNHPHVVCFANEPPIKERLSQDRWNIVNIA